MSSSKITEWKKDPEFKQFMFEILSEAGVANRVETNKVTNSDRVCANEGKSKSPVALKLPSDTTIYQPAFKKVNEKTHDAIQRISNFVDNIRLQDEIRSTPGHSQQKTSVQPKPKDTEEVTDRTAVEKVVLDAERFRAQIQPPRGKQITDLDLARLLNYVDDDDEFFNVTCHIDSSLKLKIERG